MSDNFIDVTSKIRCASEEDYLKALADDNVNFLVGTSALSDNIYTVLAASDKSITLFAKDYDIARKESSNAEDTVGKISETATMSSSKMTYRISGQAIANIRVAGYETVVVDNSTVGNVYAAECLQVIGASPVSNDGFNGVYAETYDYNYNVGSETYGYSRKGEATGAVTVRGQSSVGEITGYKVVAAEGQSWSIKLAKGGKDTYKGSEIGNENSDSESDQLAYVALGQLSLTGTGKLEAAKGYLAVQLDGDSADDVVTLGNAISGGTYSYKNSYSYKYTDSSENWSMTNSLVSAGTFTARNATGAGSDVLGYAAVVLDEGTSELVLHGGSVKDSKSGKLVNGDIYDTPPAISLERYAAGTADIRADGGAFEVDGYEKVTVSGTATTINRDDIQLESYGDEDFEDFLSFMYTLGQGFEEDAAAYTGKITVASKFDKSGVLTSATTTYAAKKGGTLAVNATGTVAEAIGYGTVTINGGKITGKVAQTMMSKWTLADVYTQVEESGTLKTERTSAFSAVESTAAGKLTMVAGTVGDIYGYATIKIDGEIDKKTKAVVSMATITGDIYADSYKYAYASKTGAETITVKASGSATITNAYLQGDIEGIEKVTLTNVTWDGGHSGDIYGGMRTASVNSGKTNSDVYDLAGTAKLTTADVGAIYGFKSVTMVDSTATAISVDNAKIAARWSYDAVAMTNSAKMAGTLALKDSAVTGVISGYATLNVKNTAASAKIPEAGSSSIGGYVGTAGADKVTFTNGDIQVKENATRAATEDEDDTIMDFGNGNNTFTIAKGTYVNVDGDILFGSGDDKLSIAQDVQFDGEDVAFGNGKNTLDIGKGATVELGDVHFGSGDDKFTLNGGFLELDSLVFDGGKNAVDIKKDSTLFLDGTISLGANTASTMKVAGEIFMAEAEAAESLAEITQLKADKTAIFSTTQEIYDDMDAKTIAGVKIVVIGDDDTAGLYRGYAQEKADDTIKGAGTFDDIFINGVHGWLSSDDGSGKYLSDTIDYYKLDGMKFGFSDNVVTTYYDAKGKVVSDISSAVYVSASLPKTGAETTAGVVTYGLVMY